MLVLSRKWSDTRIMRGSGFYLGATIGVALALALILLVGASGLSTHRVALVPSSGQAAPGTLGVASQDGGSAPVVQTGSQSGSVSPSAVGATSQGFPVFGTIIALAAAAGLGTAFYGSSSRRLNSD